MAPFSLRKRPAPNDHALGPLVNNNNNNSGEHGSSSSENHLGNSLHHMKTAEHNARTGGSRSVTNLWSLWMWEFLCWLFGTGCIFGMVGILLYFRNHPLEDWHSQIQISTIISGLSQGAQSSLMVGVSACIGQLKWPYLKKNRRTIDIRKFEEATRGPEGSLKLLTTIAFRPGGLLAAVGALITITMLMLSTFSQQTVRIDIKEVRAPFAPGGLSYATSYAQQRSSAAFFTDDRQYADLYLSRSIISGLSTDGNDPSDVASECLADHCTWPQSDTLAMCLSSEDLSSKIVDQTNGTRRTFSVEGLELEVPQMGLGQGDSTFWVGAANFGSEDLPAPHSFEASKLNSIADVYVLHYNPCDDQNTTRPDGSPSPKDLVKNWKAFKASFQLCVQTMKSDYNTTLNTTIVKNNVDINWDISEASVPNSTVKYINWCAPQSLGNVDTKFCMNNETLKSVGEEFVPIFTGAASLSSGGDNYVNGTWTQFLITDILGYNPTQCNAEAYDTTLGFNGFKNRMQYVATAITNSMRTANGTSATIPGVAWQNQAFITVEFTWFALPAAIWVMATLFFFLAVAGSRREDTPIWKSDPLVLLDAKKSKNQMGSYKDVAQEAKSTSVELIDQADGWYLKETTGPGYEIRHGEVEHIDHTESLQLRNDQKSPEIGR
ncbi:hypothetical protein P154DRAFT_534730 [Amniculicola lignicola CBS 123094]|uniref:Uncharacterized protein n=1 Tax=Amniculicola lignicola CBS 123094 TaxID=1392246 RepID=A0A6A5WHF0_9PLEO|nr:hypothetical protein P154DRAFT_534730 [Amniculicola lignicola CBS 123094]